MSFLDFRRKNNQTSVQEQDIISALRHEIDNYKSEIEELHRENKHLNAEIDNYKTRIEELFKENKQLTAEIENLNKELNINNSNEQTIDETRTGDTEIAIDAYEESIKARDEYQSDLRLQFDNAYPSNNGLRPDQLAVLYYARTFTTSQTIFQSFWFYDFAIDNVCSVLDMLCKNGFIYISSARESVYKLKVSQLKEFLKESGLKVSGKKEELIKRLLDNCDDEFLESHITDRNYELTELGKQELQENDYISYFIKVKNKYGLSIIWMNKQLHDYPSMYYRDLIWGEFNRQSVELHNQIIKGDYYEYIRLRTRMCEFLLEENNRENTALSLFCEAFNYQVNYKAIDDYKKALKIYYYYIDSEDSFDYPVLYDMLHLESFPIRSLQYCISDNEQVFFDRLKDNFDNYTKNNSIFTSSDLAGIVVSSNNNENQIIENVCHEKEKLINI